jgi:hypothetical protein
MLVSRVAIRPTGLFDGLRSEHEVQLSAFLFSVLFGQSLAPGNTRKVQEKQGRGNGGIKEEQLRGKIQVR